MKLNFGRRLVLFVHWLLSLAACALVVTLFFRSDFAQILPRLVDGVDRLAFAIAVLVVYLLFAVGSIAIICGGRKKQRDRDFIVVDSSDNGHSRIAVSAVEQMIRQAVRNVPGISELKARIANDQDSIAVDTDVVVMAGAHVPTVTANIQRAIRGYIEQNCGVNVHRVSVSVHSLAEVEEKRSRRERKKKTEVGKNEKPTAVENIPAPEPEPMPSYEPERVYAPEAPKLDADAPIELTLDAEPAPEPEPEAPEAPAEDVPAAEEAAPKKKGLFGRLFGKKAEEAPAQEAPVEESAEEAPAEPEAASVDEPEADAPFEDAPAEEVPAEDVFEAETPEEDDSEPEKRDEEF